MWANKKYRKENYGSNYSSRKRFVYEDEHDNRSYKSKGRPVKHTGASITIMQKGEHQGQECITGWNASKRKGMVTVLIAPYKGTAVHESKSGRKWVNMVCKVVYKDTGFEKLTSALYDPQSKKAIIPDLGWVVNPKARNGGYCGTFSNKD